MPSTDVGIGSRFQRDIYTVNKTLQAVELIRDAYFSVANASVAKYEYHTTDDGAILPIQLQVTSRDGQQADAFYQLTAHDLGPFDAKRGYAKQRSAVRAMQHLRFTAYLRDRQTGGLYEECFDWGIHLSMTMVENTYVRCVNHLCIAC